MNRKRRTTGGGIRGGLHGLANVNGIYFPGDRNIDPRLEVYRDDDVIRYTAPEKLPEYEPWMEAYRDDAGRLLLQDGAESGIMGVAIENTMEQFDLDILLNAGNQIDKGGELTKAGRALQKHGSRNGSIYPKATGNVMNKNTLGNQTLESILKDPNAMTIRRHHAKFGDILEIKIPGGMGVRFSADGRTFIGFLE